MKSILLVLIVLFGVFSFEPTPVYAKNTIGKNSKFNIQVPKILKWKNHEQKPYCQAFNYFFTLQLFFGLYAFFLKMIFRVFRM